MSWIPNERSAGRRRPAASAASQASFRVSADRRLNAVPSARERTILALVRSINRSRSNSKTAPSMRMFISPAVARTGPNGLTVFYIPLHLKPHVGSGAGVPQQWSSYGNECKPGPSPSRLLRRRRPPVHWVPFPVSRVPRSSCGWSPPSPDPARFARADTRTAHC
jgi:hypothetical protein